MNKIKEFIRPTFFKIIVSIVLILIWSFIAMLLYNGSLLFLAVEILIFTVLIYIIACCLDYFIKNQTPKIIIAVILAFIVYLIIRLRPEKAYQIYHNLR